MSEVKKATFTIGVVAILAGLVGAYFSYDAIEKQRYFQANGKSVQAMVVAKHSEYDSEEGWYYWAEYQFADELGNGYAGWYEVGHATYKKLVDGRSRLPVYYLPENPEAQMSPAELASKLFVILLIGCAVAFFVGLGLLIFTFLF